MVSVIVDIVVDHWVDVDVVVTVALAGADAATVSVEDVVAPVTVEVDAWLIQFTVVVTVSMPPAIQAGWDTLPNLPVCASVKQIVSVV